MGYIYISKYVTILTTYLHTISKLHPIATVHNNTV